MSKRIRLIILLCCAALFLAVTPYIILYSLGYRVDFENEKITSTGGIYVRTFPSGADVMVDSKIEGTTGIFSNSVFVQNLLPKPHNVLITKKGYYDYEKTVPVKENQVIKLENINLFKQNISFKVVESGVQYFSVAPDHNTLLAANIIKDKINFEIIDLPTTQRNTFALAAKSGVIVDLQWSRDSNMAILNISENYFLMNLSSNLPQITPLPNTLKANMVYFNPQNSQQIFFLKSNNLYSNQELTQSPLIKNVIAYQIENQNIIWLSSDGILYKSDLTGKTNTIISSQNLSIDKNASYKIITASGATLLQKNKSLLLFNQDTKSFENIYDEVNNLGASPNGQMLLYYNDEETLYSLLNKKNIPPVPINSFSEKITSCAWINDDYITCALENKVIISEIDTRGNVNIIDLAQVNLADGSNAILKNPTIFFNQQDQKLYLLNQGNLLSSDRLTP